MKAVVAAFNQEKALVGAFSVITNLRMQFGCNFLKHYTLPVVIDELYLLVCPVMGVAVIDEDVESVPLGSAIFRINIY